MKIMFFRVVFILFAFSICENLFSADLSLVLSDISLERDEKTGYHLYIRKKNDINSVLLTETTGSPDGKATNYAYRAEEWNKINGDEKRILDGKFLESEYGKFSLIDSTLEKHRILGDSFHIYIPEKILWGYPWGRNGETQITKGTFINIRCFEKPYGDYLGDFKDNPFVFDFIPRKKPVNDIYNTVALESFDKITRENNGSVIYSEGPDSIADDILKSLEELDKKKKVDVVFAIDATGSMKDDINVLRLDFVPKLASELEEFESLRIGLLLYRDYNDNYNYKNLPVKFYDFTKDQKVFFNNLNSFKIYGREGGDIPEAVYEALYSALNFYNWDKKAEKKIILIGDAEPHKKPRGKIKCTMESVTQQAISMDIKIDAIIIPDDEKK